MEVGKEGPLRPRVCGKNGLRRILGVGCCPKLIERQKAGDRRRTKDRTAQREHGDEHRLPAAFVLPLPEHSLYYTTGNQQKLRHSAEFINTFLLPSRIIF